MLERGAIEYIVSKKEAKDYCSFSGTEKKALQKRFKAYLLSL